MTGNSYLTSQFLHKPLGLPFSQFGLYPHIFLSSSRSVAE